MGYDRAARVDDEHSSDASSGSEDGDAYDGNDSSAIDRSDDGNDACASCRSDTGGGASARNGDGGGASAKDSNGSCADARDGNGGGPSSRGSNTGGASASDGNGGGSGGGYHGVRKRRWGRWVSEIREPGKKSRIWLGSYPEAEMAALAYDVAALCLRGKSATLNFPHLAHLLPRPSSSCPKHIQSAAHTAAHMSANTSTPLVHLCRPSHDDVQPPPPPHACCYLQLPTSHSIAPVSTTTIDPLPRAPSDQLINCHNDVAETEHLQRIWEADVDGRIVSATENDRHSWPPPLEHCTTDYYIHECELRLVLQQDAFMEEQLLLDFTHNVGSSYCGSAGSLAAVAAAEEEELLLWDAV